jgi:hypothetical protein
MRDKTFDYWNATLHFGSTIDHGLLNPVYLHMEDGATLTRNRPASIQLLEARLTPTGDASQAVLEEINLTEFVDLASAISAYASAAEAYGLTIQGFNYTIPNNYSFFVGEPYGDPLHRDTLTINGPDTVVEAAFAGVLNDPIRIMYDASGPADFYGYEYFQNHDKASASTGGDFFPSDILPGPGYPGTGEWDWNSDHNHRTFPDNVEAHELSDLDSGYVCLPVRDPNCTDFAKTKTTALCRWKGDSKSIPCGVAGRDGEYYFMALKPRVYRSPNAYFRKVLDYTFSRKFFETPNFDPQPYLIWFNYLASLTTPGYLTTKRETSYETWIYRCKAGQVLSSAKLSKSWSGLEYKPISVLAPFLTGPAIVSETPDIPENGNQLLFVDVPGPSGKGLLLRLYDERATVDGNPYPILEVCDGADLTVVYQTIRTIAPLDTLAADITYDGGTAALAGELKYYLHGAGPDGSDSPKMKTAISADKNFFQVLVTVTAYEKIAPELSTPGLLAEAGNKSVYVTAAQFDSATGVLTDPESDAFQAQHGGFLSNPFQDINPGFDADNLIQLAQGSDKLVYLTKFFDKWQAFTL